MSTWVDLEKEIAMRWTFIRETCGAYNAVHVQIEIVKFSPIWVGSRDVDRDRNAIPFLIIHLDTLLFCDRIY